MRFAQTPLMAALTVPFVAVATAQPPIIMQSTSGDWTIFGLSNSAASLPSLCQATTKDGQGRDFQLSFVVPVGTSERLYQVGFGDSHWHLPADVRGTITVSVKSFKLTLHIANNGQEGAAAYVPAHALVSLISAINMGEDYGAPVAVSIFNHPAVLFSTHGANNAMAAFLACADLK